MDSAIRILVWDEVNAGSARQIETLTRGRIACTVRCVDSEAEFRQQLAAYVPDLIVVEFLNLRLVEPAVLAATQRESPDRPVIIVSDASDAAHALAEYGSGAMEFVAQGDSARLTQALLRAVRAVGDRRRFHMQDQRLARLSRIYAVLSGINSLIMRVRDRQALFDGACRIAEANGNFGMAWIGLLDEQTQTVTPVAWSGRDSGSLDAVSGAVRAGASRAGQGITGRAIREKRAIFSNDLLAEPNPGGTLRKELVRRGYRSMIALPLLVQGNSVGILSLFAQETNYFNDDEFKLLNDLAQNISFALEHIAKEEKIARLSRIQSVMSSINAVMLRVRDRQELFEEACRIAVDLGGFGIAWIGAFDPDSGRISPIAWGGLESRALIHPPNAMWSVAPNAESIVGRAIREKRAVFDNDLRVNAATSGRLRQDAVRRGYHSLIVLPLLARGAVAGNLSIFAREANFFTDDEVNLLTELTGGISFALEYLEKEERLNYLAYNDVLTGLPNRYILRDRLAQAMSNCNRTGRIAAVAFIDLDHFKWINDSLGHSAGDKLLQVISARLAECIRDGDTLARLGGDEFVLVIPDQADVETTVNIIQRILASVNMPIEDGHSEFSTACSIGIALYPQDGGDVDTLMKHADTAMYKAKESGRNSYRFYTKGMNEEISGRFMMESRLRRALGRGELFLVYQPQFDLKSGRITAVEALVRWQNPDLGLMLPDRFIPWAEESDLILSIGAWVMRQACAQICAWQAMKLPAIGISVNVSARQFRQSDFLEIVAGILRETGLEPRYLTLELTESVVMNNVAEIIATMNGFDAMGVELSIDDFGTGYSSLSYLKRFPVARLKIDQSFVRDIVADADDAAIAQAVISLGHSLGLKVVAEGVETAAQLAFLRDRGCDEVQGHYFSKPLDADDLRALLMQSR